MSAFLRLFKCHLKRFFSAAGGLAAFSTVFFAVLAFIAIVFTKNMSFSGTREKLKIGIVGDLSIPYFEAGINTLKYLDSSNEFVEIQTLTLEQADSLMKKGKLSAYVIIPEGFIESVEYGQNDMQVTYVTASGAQGIESIFKEHIADIVSSYLINAQAGIFSMENLAVKNKQRAFLNDYLYEMNVDYIKWTLDRKNFIRKVEIPLSNGVGIYSYYLCAIICSFLIFFGIGCLSFFTGPGSDRKRFFSSKGINPCSQVLSEYLAYFLLLIFCLVIVFIFIMIVSVTGKLSIPEWKFSGAVAGVLKLFTASLCVGMMFCAMQIMLFEIVNQTVPSILLQFLTGFCLSFTGGCFYPLDFFPDSIRLIGKVLPAGQALNFLDSVLSGNINFLYAGICICYTVVFICVTILIRSSKIKGEADE